MFFGEAGFAVFLGAVFDFFGAVVALEEEPPELFAEPELLPEPDFFEVVALEEEPPELLPEPDFFEVVALEEELPKFLLELPEFLPEPELPELLPEPVFLPELPELLPEPELPGWFAGVLELSGSLRRSHVRSVRFSGHMVLPYSGILCPLTLFCQGKWLCGL